MTDRDDARRNIELAQMNLNDALKVTGDMDRLAILEVVERQVRDATASYRRLTTKED